MKRGFLLLLILFAFATPLLAQAALVPCDGVGQNPCQACHLVSLIQRVITFIITVAVPVLGILVAYAGFLYFSSGVSPGNIERAKNIFFSALIGFILMLGAWLIINFILQTLVGGQLGGRPWNQIQCADVKGQAAPKPSGTVKETPLPEIPAEPGTVPGSAKLSDASAREKLDSGIAVASFRQDSFDGVRTASIDHANNLFYACGAGCINITGAVGPHAPGTYSHANGFKLDFAPTPKLENFITANSKQFRQVADRQGSNGGKQYVDTCGNSYVREKDHWDVTIYRPCAF